MPYAVTALADGKALRQTRVMPASAAVLAMRWMDEGYTDVRIVADGLSYTLDSFRWRFHRPKNRWTQRGNADPGCGAA